MNSIVLLFCAIVSLPAITNAFLFGVSVTNAAGAVIAAANPAQTAGIIGLGTLGAALGTAALAALQPRPPTVTVIRPSTTSTSSKGKYYRRHRGKRQIIGSHLGGGTTGELSETFNRIFLEIEAQSMDICFQRLICEIIAGPEVNRKGESFQLINAIEIAMAFRLNAKARAVAQKIASAKGVGKRASSVEACRTTYSQCKWTGPEMQQAIQQFQLSYN